MAYFAWNSAREGVLPIEPLASETLSGIGAYFAWNSVHEPVLPINGLGASPQEALFDQEMRDVAQRQPLALVRVGEQKSDVDQSPVPNVRLDLLAVSESEIALAERQAGGIQVPRLAIVSKQKLLFTAVERALSGTPYELSHVEIAQPLTSAGALSPEPLWLYIVSPRDPDDPEGGRASVRAAAARLDPGAVVTYPIAVTEDGAPAPTPPLMTALPTAPVGPPAAPAQAAHASGSKALLFLGVGAGAASLIWLLARRAG